MQRTLALLVTAALLYIPANILPIMITEKLGSESPSTIVGGIVLLLNHGSWMIALVIFVASVLVPLGKMMTLCYLCWTLRYGSRVGPTQRTIIYRITEFVGKWSMIDVFVVAILVSLVHLGGLLVIQPGLAGLAFAGVVIVTMLAAESFDPRLIWDRQEQANV